MDTYTYGSPEGVQALKDRLRENPGEGHFFTLGFSDRADMANALETAAIAGRSWAEEYTGFPVHEAVFWPPHLAEMDLDNEQMMGLIDTLALAHDLGDDFAGEWLSCLCECVDIEWI